MTVQTKTRVTKAQYLQMLGAMADSAYRRGLFTTATHAMMFHRDVQALDDSVEVSDSAAQEPGK